MNSLWIKLSLILLGFMTSASLHAQVTIDRDLHNFGNISASSNRTTDFIITNHYQFSVILSSFSFDFDYSTAASKISLEPGDTMTYRIKLTPSKKGPYNKVIPLTFFRLSDTLKINLTANILTTDFDDNSSLEPFEPQPGENDEKFKDIPFQLRVLDVETKQPIEGARISFSIPTPSYRTLKTDRNGFATRNLHNRYEVSVSASGYEMAKFGISLGCSDSIRTVLLAPYDPNKKREFEYFYEYEAQNPIKTEDTLDRITSEIEQKLLEPFSEGNYKPNNIVFLMDVSASMLDHDRLSLLKSSILQLVELLRPEDIVSIITFSDETKILIPPTALTKENKVNIIKTITNLESGGMTNGGKGLKTAFKLVRDNFNEDNNNQVILATDGALGAYMEHDKIIEMVKKNVAYATTSIMTLNGYNWSGKFMRQITKAGQGNLLPINSEKEAKLILVKAIKENSELAS
ncbi:MAG: VWA domain-containing protein [Crocinitomicaceae bacterium]